MFGLHTTQFFTLSLTDQIISKKGLKYTYMTLGTENQINIPSTNGVLRRILTARLPSVSPLTGISPSLRVSLLGYWAGPLPSQSTAPTAGLVIAAVDSSGNPMFASTLDLSSSVTTNKISVNDFYFLIKAKSLLVPQSAGLTSTLLDPGVLVGVWLQSSGADMAGIKTFLEVCIRRRFFLSDTCALFQ
jgi:hypothetical protein